MIDNRFRGIRHHHHHHHTFV